MNTQSNRLGTESVKKLLFSLALPAITAQIINALYNLVDRMYIGRMPETGSLALAGLGIAFPLIMIISAFSALIGMGGAPRAAIKMGEGDNDGAEKILSNSFITLLLISAGLMLLFFFTKDTLLTLFGATAQTLPFASDYFGIYLFGTFFVQISMGLNPFISSQGFAKVSMQTVLIGAITNIVLDPILIFGLGMGVKGAATATIISQFISSIWVLRFLFSQKSIIKIKKEYFKIDPSVILPVLSLGIAPFIMQSTESLVQVTLNSGLKIYGGAQVDEWIAAMSIIMSTMQFMLMPIVGLSQGAQPIISFNYGAGNLSRVKETFKLLLIASMAFTTATWATCMLAPGIFVSIFSTDPSVMALSMHGMRIFMAGMLVMGAQFACQQSLVALGQAKVSMFLALLRKIILLIPLAIILPKFLGLEGIFIAEPVADIIATATTVIVFTIYTKKLFASVQQVQ